jgi:putative transposase
MSTYTQIIYQIVFGTKYRQKTLSKENRPKLFEYIAGIIRNKKCHLYRINAVEDHMHILIRLHPTVALSYLIRDIKVASAEYINEHSLFKNFKGWQDGYGAFTYSIREKDILIEYVKNQEVHHGEITFEEEYVSMLKEQGVDFDEKYLL